MDLITACDKNIMYIDKEFTYYHSHFQALKFNGFTYLFQAALEKDILVLMHRVLFTHNIFREYGLVSVINHQKVIYC